MPDVNQPTAFINDLQTAMLEQNSFVLSHWEKKKKIKSNLSSWRLIPAVRNHWVFGTSGGVGLWAHAG